MIIYDYTDSFDADAMTPHSFIGPVNPDAVRLEVPTHLVPNPDTGRPEVDIDYDALTPSQRHHLKEHEVEVADCAAHTASESFLSYRD